ncbi:MAG: branched-chain amino acid ABC transporter permease [Ktedonobacteraceae bacterium]
MSNGRRLRIGASIAVALFVLIFPFIASTFFLVQIGVQSLFLGIVALSLIFLSGYGGLVSLAQIALYGSASYTYAILTVSYNLPWYIGVVGALLFSTLLAALFALVSVRTQGIYFLMITLAEAMLVFYFAQQDRIFTNGHTGINGVRPPTVGLLVFSDPVTFYYMALIVTVLIYLGLRYTVRSPFGLAIQGIRDNPRRMRSLGYSVLSHRIAAFTLAGCIAGVGGILGVWYDGAISPGSIDLTRTINILVIAVLGGLTYFEGAFVGAIFFTLITNFASSFTNRFETVIGFAFLLVALFFPDGLIGLSKKVIQLGLQLVAKNTSTATSSASQTVRKTAHPRHTPSSIDAEGKQLLTISGNTEEEKTQ